MGAWPPNSGFPTFPVSQFGRSANGLYDDQSIQRAINFAAQTAPTARILIDVQIRIPNNTGGLTGTSAQGGVAVKMPATGAYIIEAAGGPFSIFAVNAGNTTTPAIIILGTIGGQPQTIGQPANMQCVFDCSAAISQGGSGAFNIVFRDLLCYDQAVAQVSYLSSLTNSVFTADFERIATQSCGLAFGGTKGAAGQVQRINVLHCNGLGQALNMPNWSPLGGEIAGCVWNEPGDGAMPTGALGSFLDQQVYTTWEIHDNFFSAQGGPQGSTQQRAWLNFHAITQTINGNIHGNTFYGCSGRGIYWKDDTAAVALGHTAGIHIYDNEFVAWNQDNRIANGAAITIDTSAAGNPDQLIAIGTNTFDGGSFGVTNFSARGIELVDNADTAQIVLNPAQVMKNIVTAGFRVNLNAVATDLVTVFPAFRLHGGLTAPGVPATTVPLTNTTGFDADVYITAGAATCTVTLDGTAVFVIPASGVNMVRIPRGAIVILTYTAAPTWVWRIA